MARLVDFSVRRAPLATGRRSSGEARCAPQIAVLAMEFERPVAVHVNEVAAWTAPTTRTTSNVSSSISSTTTGAYSSIEGPGVTQTLERILPVEKPQTMTIAAQAASASRRLNEARIVCPVQRCGATFAGRTNLRRTSYTFALDACVCVGHPAHFFLTTRIVALDLFTSSGPSVFRPPSPLPYGRQRTPLPLQMAGV